MLLADAAIDGLVAKMRVHVDEAGHHHQAAAVDRDLGGAAEIRPDVRDAARPERDIDPLAVDVALLARVPGNRPAGILDQGCGHGIPFATVR